MFDRLARSLLGPAWKPGFRPSSSMVLDVERRAPSGGTAPRLGSNYREPDAPFRRVEEAGPITALTYTCSLVWIGDEHSRQEWYVRRVEPSASGRGVLAWQHAITEAAFGGRWLGRLGDAIVGCDGDGRLVARDAKSGDERWRGETLVAAPMKLANGAVRGLFAGETWMDLDPSDGRVIDRGTWRSATERDALVKGHVDVSGGQSWEFGRVLTPVGEVTADDPHLVVESVIDGKKTSKKISFAPWRAQHALVSCDGTLVVWVARADTDRRRYGALVLLDAQNLEEVGRIDLGKGSDSLRPAHMAVCGRHVQLSVELGHDSEGDLTDVVKLVDISSRRVVADLYGPHRPSLLYAGGGTLAVPL